MPKWLIKIDKHNLPIHYVRKNCFHQPSNRTLSSALSVFNKFSGWTPFFTAEWTFSLCRKKEKLKHKGTSTGCMFCYSFFVQFSVEDPISRNPFAYQCLLIFCSLFVWLSEKVVKSEVKFIKRFYFLFVLFFYPSRILGKFSG
jgi:hypothetical protein